MTGEPAKYDPTTLRLMEMIRHQRKALGLTMREAAERAGIERSWWCHVETGGRAVQLRTLESMANGVGLAVSLRRIDEPDGLPADRANPEVRVSPTSQTVQRIARRIMDARRALGMSVAEAAAKVGWKHSRWRALELSQTASRTIPLAYLEWAADVVGLRILAVTSGLERFADLDEREVEWLAGLVRQYHLTVRNPSPVGRSVARKIAQRQRAEGEAAA